MHRQEPLIKAHRAMHDQTIQIYGVDVRLRRLTESDAQRNVYGEAEVKQYGPFEVVKAVIRFPEQAVALGHRSLFFEEFLPVEAEFKYEDAVKIGDQVEVEYLHPDNRRQPIIMDLVDTKVTSAMSEAAGITFLLAPVRQ